MSKYVIGCRLMNKNNELVEGFLAHDWINYVWIPAQNNSVVSGSKPSVFVLETAEDAEKFVQHLRNFYKDDFSKKTKELGISKSEFRFWPKKVASSTTPFTLEKDVTSGYYFYFKKHNLPYVKFYTAIPKICSSK